MMHSYDEVIEKQVLDTADSITIKHVYYNLYIIKNTCSPPL